MQVTVDSGHEDVTVLENMWPIEPIIVRTGHTRTTHTRSHVVCSFERKPPSHKSMLMIHKPSIGPSLSDSWLSLTYTLLVATATLIVCYLHTGASPTSDLPKAAGTHHIRSLFTPFSLSHVLILRCGRQAAAFAFYLNSGGQVSKPTREDDSSIAHGVAYHFCHVDVLCGCREGYGDSTRRHTFNMTRSTVKVKPRS